MSKRYSPSGNILSTHRNGIVGWDVQEQPVISSIDNMTYTYTGAAQLQSITDSRPGLQGFASGTTAYTYDGRGNVTGASGRRAYGITYNPLDLPYRIEGKTRDEIWYTHSREKLRVCQQEGQNDVCRLYLGNLELEWDPITETYKPKAWHHPEGKMMLHAEPQSNIKDRIRLHYYLRDHLGNTVVAFDDRNYDGAISDVEEGTQSEVIGRYHYYAFGMQWNHAWVGSDIGGYWQQRYRYNGKELHSNSGLLDYGFRYYDPSVGRFTGVDPMASKYPSWSPYTYVLNNPIKFIDPDGRSVKGDFLNQKGERIGNDGKTDGKPYVMKTSEKKFTENGVSVPGAGLSSKAVKAATSFIESNSGKAAAFEANPGIYDNFTEIVGDAGVRQQMYDIVSADNGAGGAATANNREYNGGIMPDGSVQAGTPGPFSSPLNPITESGSYPPGASILFHSHPSGTVTTGGVQLDPFGGNSSMGTTRTTGFRQSASPRDIQNAGSEIRYTFGMGNPQTVYMYNNKGVQATLPASQFIKPK